jgi:hypothetical protein
MDLRWSLARLGIEKRLYNEISFCLAFSMCLSIYWDIIIEPNTTMGLWFSIVSVVVLSDHVHRIRMRFV